MSEITFLQIVVSILMVTNAICFKLIIDLIKGKVSVKRFKVEDELIVLGKLKTLNGVSVYDSRIKENKTEDNE